MGTLLGSADQAGMEEGCPCTAAPRRDPTRDSRGHAWVHSRSYTQSLGTAGHGPSPLQLLHVWSQGAPPSPLVPPHVGDRHTVAANAARDGTSRAAAPARTVCGGAVGRNRL